MEPHSAAPCAAVHPESLAERTSAPAAMSVRTSRASPFSAQTVSAVSPFEGSRALTSRPSGRRRSMSARTAADAARAVGASTMEGISSSAAPARTSSPEDARKATRDLRGA